MKKQERVIPAPAPTLRGKRLTANGNRKSLSAIQNLGPASRWLLHRKF